MLQNVCENCVQILENEKHVRMFVILRKKSERNWHPNRKPKREKSKTLRTAGNIAAININSQHRLQQLNISETSLRRILHKVFGMT